MSNPIYKNPSVQVAIGEAMWIELLSVEADHKIIEKKINMDAFRVSHTGMTYRQINHLDQAGLLGSGRDDKENGWRIFKFRDIVYLQILIELKKFGLRNEQLKGLHEAFYKLHHMHMDEVILACLGGIEMTLTLKADGTGIIFNPPFLSLYDDKGYLGTTRDVAEIRLVVNYAVNDALKAKIGKSIDIKYSAAKSANADLLKTKPSELELKILEVIRDESYDQVKLKKKNGNPSVLYATSKAKSDISENQLMTEITKQAYSDVQIKYRDGKVVHYQHETTIKL